VETADDPSCQAANDVFEEHFVRGAKSLPAVAECEGITGGDAVYRHMWGAAEFTATGVLRDYDRTERLGELKLPVLFLAGRHDEAAPETVADFQRRVPGAKMQILENSAFDLPDGNGGAFRSCASSSMKPNATARTQEPSVICRVSSSC
jgi:proline iminopeptidase